MLLTILVKQQAMLKHKQEKHDKKQIHVPANKTIYSWAIKKYMFFINLLNSYRNKH